MMALRLNGVMALRRYGVTALWCYARNIDCFAFMPLCLYAVAPLRL